MRAPTLLVFFSLTAGLARAAIAADAVPTPTPLVHPIYAQLPDLPEGDVTRREFAAAATRYRLTPLEVIDIPRPPAPKTPDTLKATFAKALKLAFDEALPELDAAIAEVIATGGAGLSTAELSDLYLYRGMALARADWNGTAPAEMSALNSKRARAFADYVRAAALSPFRVLDAHALPPQVVADFARALETTRRAPRCTLVIKGDADAHVRVDGSPPLPLEGGLTLKDLPAGEHFVAVEQLGRPPWGTALSFTESGAELTIPAQPPLSLSDLVAADHARRMGARFALVAERKPGPGAPLELRLVDLAGEKRDAALVSTLKAEKGAIDAAVMRLDEQARQIEQLEIAGTLTPAVPVAEAPGSPPLNLVTRPPPARPTFEQNPVVWARDRWPLLTAIGVMAASAIVLGVAASN
jgi:hypothetical protein